VTFSIVTPSYEQAPWLAECLGSVRAAAERVPHGVEHIVVDGGSTDGSTEILAGQTFARWVSEPDRGQTHAINKGLAMARGDIFSYLCADDLLEPAALGLVARAFESTEAPDVVYGDGYFLEGDSGWKRPKRAGEFSVRRLRRGNFLIQPSVFWRREVTACHGLLDAGLGYCMDHEYWLRIAKGTRWAYVGEPLATCRLHGPAKTSRALAEAWEEAARMQARHGLRVRPRLEALWMRMCGQHYYRLKRSVLQQIGRRRRRNTS
jgi:glycosyltransferase involved in cell wall biosynthesis